MLNIEDETKQLLANYKDLVKHLIEEVHSRGDMIKRLLNELDEARHRNQDLPG